MADNNKSIGISLTCELCSEYFTEPLVLSNCLHSFCKKCLVKTKDNQGEAEGCIKCPTCDTSTTGKVDDLTVNQWLVHKVKEASLKESINSKESISCSECVYGDEASSAAKSFCCECCQFLCDLCLKVHKRKFRHELIKLGEKKISNEMPEISRQAVYCTKHSDEKLIFYCKTCEGLVCRNCTVTNKHKDHTIVDHSEERDCAHGALKQSTVTAGDVIDSLSQAIANGEKMLELIDVRKKEVDKMITDTFSSLQNALKNRFTSLILDAEEVANNKRKVVNGQLEEFRKIKKRASYASKIASSLSECPDPGEVLSIKKLVTDQVTQCDTVVKKMPLDIKEDETIATRLDSKAMLDQIDQFGSVFEVDPSLYSLDKGIAIPLATVEKERMFTLTVPHSIDDNPLMFLQGVMIKSDHSEEEVKPIIATDKDSITTISCTPISSGQYELSLTIGSRPIKGSPYHIYAKGIRNYGSLKNERTISVSGTYGVAVHPITGEVFASSNNGIVQVFNKDSNTAVHTIGSSGNGDGQFGSPFGLLLIGDTLYVTDTNTHRVQYFSTTSRECLGKFGSNGSGKEQFSNPRGMAHDGKGNIIVADYSNNRLQVFTTDGTFIKTIACNGNPNDVAVDNDGYIHAAIHNQHYIQVFTPEGTSCRTYRNPSNGNFQNPQGITIDDEGNKFIMNYHSGNSSYRYLNILDSSGAQINLISGFNNPWGVTLDSEGHIYVADYSNSRIMKYSEKV